jgi:hypothetical protein
MQAQAQTRQAHVPDEDVVTGEDAEEAEQSPTPHAAQQNEQMRKHLKATPTA